MLLLPLVAIAAVGLALLLFSERTTPHPAQPIPENVDMRIGRIGHLGLNRRRLSSGGALGSAVTYDTSIGNSVNINGRADLTPRVGAKWFYVNATTGSDTNTSTQAQNPATPVATIQKGASFVTDGEGDHVLVAQGMSYTNGFCHIGDKGGFSPQCPLVIQSYDPADPTNQAKWGTATGSNRPDINATGVDSQSGFIQGSGASKQYRAFRGLKFDGGNQSAVALNVLCNTTGTPDYLLFENCEFAQVQLSVEGNNTPNAVLPITKLIVRNCSSHGQWDSTGAGRSQGIFVNTLKGLTVEDCVLWRAGWKEGALRTDAPAAGGPSPQAHSLYFQDDTRNVVVRRCAFVDNSEEGVGQLKGGGLCQNNLILNNPIAASMGGGNDYTVDAPFGIYIEYSGNAALTAVGAGAWGWHINNGRQSVSAIHHNVLAHSGVAAYAMMADAPNDLMTDPTYHSGWNPNTTAAKANPCFGNFYNNVNYQWSSSGGSTAIGLSGGNVGLITVTFNNNIWDDPTSGTNVNVGSVTFPNAYTETSLLSALGYASEAAAVADWIANPQAHAWRSGPSLMQSGYGVSQGLVDLVTDTRLTIGVPTTGQFIGTLDGSSLSAIGLPTDVTLDSNCRCWSYGGAGTAGTTSSTITETNGSSSHNTTLNWTVSAQPVLSSLAVTPSGTTATATISTNVGSGMLYWMASTKSVVPNWQHVREGIDADELSAGKAYGSQAVTATGTQTINVTGLASGQTYYFDVIQIDGGNNPSATSQLSFASWSPASLGANLAVDCTSLAMSNLWQDTAGATPVTADGQTVKRIKDPTTGIIFTNGGAGWVYHANGGHPYLQMDGTSVFGSTTPITFGDANGQYGIFATIQQTGSGNMFLFYSAAYGNLMVPNATTGANNAYVRSTTAQLAGAWSSGVALNTDTVVSGISTGSAGSGHVEAFVNNVDTPGSGIQAWTGTPEVSDTIRINNPSTAAGRLNGFFIYKGDPTSIRSNAQTYMAALHP